MEGACSGLIAEFGHPIFAVPIRYETPPTRVGQRANGEADRIPPFAACNEFGIVTAVNPVGECTQVATSVLAALKIFDARIPEANISSHDIELAPAIDLARLTRTGGDDHVPQAS